MRGPYRIQRPNVTESVVEGLGIRGSPTFELYGQVLPVAIVGSSPEDGHLGTVILVDESAGEPLGTAENPMHTIAASGSVSRLWSVSLPLQTGETAGTAPLNVPDPAPGFELLRYRLQHIEVYLSTPVNPVNRMGAIAVSVAGPVLTQQLDRFTFAVTTGNPQNCPDLFIRNAVVANAILGIRVCPAIWQDAPAGENPQIAMNASSTFAQTADFIFRLEAEYTPS